MENNISIFYTFIQMALLYRKQLTLPSFCRLFTFIPSTDASILSIKVSGLEVA